MDFLEEILDVEFKNSRGTKYIPISEIFNVHDAWVSADRKQIIKMKSFGKECKNRIISLKYLSKEEKKSSMNRDEIMNYFANTLKNTIKNPKILTLQTVIAKCFTDKKENADLFDGEFYGMRHVMMDLLYMSYGELVLECFESTGGGTIETLEEYEECDSDRNTIEIFGKRYIKTRRRVYNNRIDVEWNAMKCELMNA